MGEYFNLRSHLLLYEYSLGISEPSLPLEQQAKLKRNAKRFEQLQPDAKKRFNIIISSLKILATVQAL